MPDDDRAELIGLLNRLGDPDDAAALAAAREIDTRVNGSGIGWDTLLISGEPPGIPDDVAVPEHDLLDAAPAAAGPEDLALIDRLLARNDLSDVTREELIGMRADVESGDFAEMDRKYLRSLANRLR